ncbi:phospholipase D-like domain-containing protein [Halovenus sp. HT40]|uniref:phospholipase D-like domain-containing protein n=1 Tax=Halovenus sp. HT40 TaxID=3126691 RepID=UPI00300E7D4A
MRWPALLCCVLAVTVALPTAVASSPDAVQASPTAVCPSATDSSDTQGADSTGPRIVELYPDPAAHEDAGEFVTVEFSAGTNLSRFALLDEDSPVSLGDRTNRSHLRERTRITFSTDPALTDRFTNRTVHSLPDRVQLANGGDDVRLLRDGTAVQRVSYDSATEAEVYGVGSGDWRPLCATDHPIRTARGGSVEAFVLPDEPTRAVEFLDSADERIYLAGYTLSSQAVVDALVAADDRGVAVRVLVDGSPAGGLSDAAAAALTELDRSGVDLRLVDGERARYRFHHPKYAVVDGRALVTTENWKPSGLGGRSSRGWAVITDQQRIVDGLVQTFRSDTGWIDATVWSPPSHSSSETEPPSERYPAEFETRSFAVERTELLLTPDNAESRLRQLIENASTSIRLKQVSIGDESFPLLQAVLDAARRGVEVEILLSGAWYVEEENERLRRSLTERAAAENLPVEIRVADPGERYEKIHAKGLIVDGDTTVVGSINWNNNSLQNNREAALLIESDGVASYFGRVFAADWEAAASTESPRAVPVGLIIAVCFAVVLAGLGLRTLTFESRSKRSQSSLEDQSVRT